MGMITLNGCKREFRVGDIWLMEGDSAEILPQLEPTKDRGIITDPNYGIEADKAKAHSSIRDNDEWDSFGWDKLRPSREVFESILRFSQVAIWGGNYFADMLPASPAWLAWIKPEADSGFSLADMELCWTNRKFAARVRKFPRRDGNLHPTQKPVAVIDWTMKFVTSKTIIDPFLGSGTTAVACIRRDIRCVGIEREPKYFDIACERVAAEFKRTELFDAPQAATKAKQKLIF